LVAGSIRQGAVCYRSEAIWRFARFIE